MRNFKAMLKQNIDINCDMGEGLDIEPQLMPYISSCNIACGGHAGTEESMNKVIALAKDYGVKIGVHPSFPDKENFGRQAMDITCADLFSSLKSQVRLLQTCLKANNAHLHHLKPHGALYNLAVEDEKTAKVIVEVVKSISKPIKLYVPDHSVIAHLARRNGILVCSEGFADRRYHQNLSLVSRKDKEGLIESEELVFEQVNLMVKEGVVNTIEGKKVPINIETTCVHGDHKNAVRILHFLNGKLKENHIEIL